jgi:hypothetical protein
MKELRELTKLESVDFVVDPSELERGMTPATREEVTKQRVCPFNNYGLLSFSLVG